MNFQDLVKLDAWRELEKWIDQECQNSMKRMDNIDAQDLKLNQVCEERGYRNGLRKVLREVRQRAEGR